MGVGVTGDVEAVWVLEDLVVNIGPLRGASRRRRVLRRLSGTLPIGRLELPEVTIL